MAAPPTKAARMALGTAATAPEAVILSLSQFALRLGHPRGFGAPPGGLQEISIGLSWAARCLLPAALAACGYFHQAAVSAVPPASAFIHWIYGHMPWRERFLQHGAPMMKVTFRDLSVPNSVPMWSSFRYLDWPELLFACMWLQVPGTLCKLMHINSWPKAAGEKTVYQRCVQL